MLWESFENNKSLGTWELNTDYLAQNQYNGHTNVLHYHVPEGVHGTYPTSSQYGDTSIM
jgi:hypothetical protein